MDTSVAVDFFYLDAPSITEQGAERSLVTGVFKEFGFNDEYEDFVKALLEVLKNPELGLPETHLLGNFIKRLDVEETVTDGIHEIHAQWILDGAKLDEAGQGRNQMDRHYRYWKLVLDTNKRTLHGTLYKDRWSGEALAENVNTFLTILRPLQLEFYVVAADDGLRRSGQLALMLLKPLVDRVIDMTRKRAAKLTWIADIDAAMTEPIEDLFTFDDLFTAIEAQLTQDPPRPPGLAWTVIRPDRNTLILDFGIGKGDCKATFDSNRETGVLSVFWSTPPFPPQTWVAIHQGPLRIQAWMCDAEGHRTQGGLPFMRGMQHIVDEAVKQASKKRFLFG